MTWVILTETCSSPDWVWKPCQTCSGSGKMLLGSGCGTSEGTSFYEHDCFGCLGAGRILDLGETLKQAVS